MTSGSASRPGKSTPTDAAPGAAVALVTDERALVERIRSGDEQAFAQLFDAYYDRLFRLARHILGGDEDAQEVVSDLFLQLWAGRARWVLERSLTAYLYTIARNRALNALRARRTAARWAEHMRVAANSARESARPLHTQSPDATLETRELAERIAAAIAALPERARTVFCLFRDHGLSYAEIAQVMSLSTHTVDAHMTRAVRGLRAALSDYPVPSPVGRAARRPTP